jgi:hypothetical protein
MPDRKRRPLRVTLFVMLILWLTLWNGLRLGEAIFFGKTLQEYHAGPFYIGASGGVWLLLGLALAWGAWAGKPWAWIASIAGTAGYTLWSWFDRLALQKARVNNSFALAVTLLLLAIVSFILFTRRTRQFFRKENHGTEPEAPTTA